MKKLYFLCLTALIGLSSFGQTNIFINEIHYDNTGADVDEAIEIAGPAGTDLTGWSIEKYNGSNNESYGNESLSGTISDQENGYGTLNFIFAANSLQNGSPDAIALVDNMGNVVQFLSYEGSLTAADGPAAGMTSTDIGVEEGGTTQVGESLQLMGSGDSYEEFTWETLAIANTYGLVNTNQTFTSTNTPSITITSPSNGFEFVPGTTSVDVEFSGTNLQGGETFAITVNSTTTTGVTSPFTVATVDGQTYNVLVELVDGTILDSDMITFSVLSSNTVATVAELRAGTLGEVYELTGEAIITYIVTDNGRNQKYIQDATAGILIDDNAGTLTPSFNIGDGITGLQGQLGEFNGVLQFVPVADVAGASSTGTTITPEAVTVSQFLAAGESYESELIQITGVTFADTGVFTDNTSYDISAGADTTVARVTFGDENLVGANIPTGTSSVIGLGAEFNGTYQVLPRYVSDVAGATLSINEVSTNSFSVYPNPTSTGFVNVVGTNDDAISVSVYDILGKQVINQALNNNRINVSGLNAGVYIVKISQNDAQVTKKLVIK
ncbi:T9SS type A sorting domain-containing protein [Psychroserpens sp. Hel_I_66]|uniref:T9SS type A sorting domain-containing protein n=1 Tax=Psychroserpens sp. Hel_I_66 TaxID=1250004 RepID=UPI000692472A|nr:T9SS type A sorting domain-containing protein [Psychroserpens sp. Hel_I_66]